MSGHQFGDLTGLTVTVTQYRLRQVLSNWKLCAFDLGHWWNLLFINGLSFS